MVLVADGPCSKPPPSHASFHFSWANLKPAQFKTDTQLVRLCLLRFAACPMHHVGVGQVLDPHVKSLDAEAAATGIPSLKTWYGMVLMQVRTFEFI